MRCSDGGMRDLVTSQPGAGWDYAQTRHPYHMVERPLGPHYCLYNRRQMAVRFDAQTVEDGYWLLRQKAAVLHTGELPLQFKGPDAERLLDRLFTKDITKIRPGRCGYGLACYEDGGMIVDGVLLRLEPELFWYVQADGDFYSWARAHGAGLDVEISDPDVFASQVQGPDSLNLLERAAKGGLPEKFTYFGIARVDLGGQEVVITRTGYTNELGWEFYTEPHHDAEALWAHLEAAGAQMHGLDSMNIRRVEAGILNAGSDFNLSTTPYDVGLGRFVDQDKGDFIGKAALMTPTPCRLWGIKCPEGEPLISAPVLVGGVTAGVVTAGAISPYLRAGIGIALMDDPSHGPGTQIKLGCREGVHPGELVEMPFYDKDCLIPRGKLVDIPQRTA